MKKLLSTLLVIMLVTTMLVGCSQKQPASSKKNAIKIGIMLSDVGLGDQSFSDSAFAGLEQARDNLGILFDYKEISDTGTYEKGLTELVKQGNDLVVGLGFGMQQDIEKLAKKYPKRTFLLVDAVSDLPNVYSVTFKEQEGSYLLGALAGMKTKTNKVGFIGGMNVPVVNKFLAGFQQGVQDVNPNAQVLYDYAGTFDDDKIGRSMAESMIQQGADFIYPAAGFTGIGAIQAAQDKQVYAFGVDSDQYFIAEHAVVSSMTKKIDVAMYEIAKQLVKNGKISNKHLELGIAEKGVGLAPIRVLSLSNEEQSQLNALVDEISKNKKQIRDK
ncbi:BMP family ABC transporter substrate-binding protein [Microbacteriaceae bacterium 4G12]